MGESAKDSQYLLSSRSRSEIIANIRVSLSRGDKTRTEVMHDAFLSFAQATDYLSYLTDKDLANFETRRSRYVLTERGKRLIDSFEGLGNFVKIAPFDKVGASF